MQHTDHDTLAMLAVGEAPTPSVSAHLAVCDSCSAELSSLQAVVVAGRSGSPDDVLLTPPPEVWEGISAHLGLTAGSSAARDATDDDGAAGPRAETRHATPFTATAHPNGARPTPSAPSPAGAPQRRSRRAAMALAACAALLGAAAGSGITWWAVDRTAPVEAVAGQSRALDPLVPSALGTARVGESAGERKLEIKVKGLPKTAGYFEVWLMDRNHKKLISMGVLGPDGRAVLPVPDNVNLDEYTVVDVSIQPYNGSPAHSGKSIVRGPFAG